MLTPALTVSTRFCFWTISAVASWVRLRWPPPCLPASLRVSWWAGSLLELPVPCHQLTDPQTPRAACRYTAGSAQLVAGPTQTATVTWLGRLLSLCTVSASSFPSLPSLPSPPPPHTHTSLPRVSVQSVAGRPEELCQRLFSQQSLWLEVPENFRRWEGLCSGIHSHKTLDTAELFHLLKPN